MNILAIETSCDETSVAIVRDGREVLANIIASQIGLHQRFGGVVPELASRQHIVTLIPTLEEAMRHAGLDWDGIDAIAVTCGPGLAGALLVGLNAAKAIAFARNKPLIAVNHLEAHIYSNWIIPETLDHEAPPAREPRPAAEQTRAGAALRALGVEPPRRAGETDLPPGPPAGGRPQYTPPPPKQEAPRPRLDQPAPTDPAFPLLCLVVSGGHTELIYMSGHGQYSLLGKTVDDAAGEAFDKVARVLGLPYPGGPAIQRVAAFGNPDAINLPRTVLRGSADFSFSGLKTAVLRQAQNYGPPITPEEQAAEREAAERARREEEARVAAEERARREAEERARREEEARIAAEERARREAEERARWEAEEQARREAAEERRAAAAARRVEEERARQEDADRRAAEARTPRATPPPAAEDRPSRAAGTSERPAISILGGGRTTLRPTPPEPASETLPDRPAPPAEAEAEPPAPPRKSRNAGLIRVTPESIRPEAGPPPGAVERFDREPAPPITVRPERDTPRVLGKSEQEEVPPPAFLAERGGGTPPTPMRRRPATPVEPDVPAFLRGRPQPAEPPATPPAGKKSSPPSAPATPAKPASRATTPEQEEQRPARPAPTAPTQPPDAPRATRLANAPGPATPPPSRAPESRTTPAPPTQAKPAPPTPPERANTPAAPTPPRPAPPRRPLDREVRAIPKSVQAGRAPREGTEEDDVDQAIDDLLDEQAPAQRKKSSWLDPDEDEDLGTDDEPPPRPGRGSLGLDGPRSPEARVPVPPADESDEDAEPDAGTSKRRPAKPKPEKPRLPVADFAASFQAAAVEILVDKTVAAAAAYKVRTVLLAGGVAANAHLRERLRERLGADITLRYPPPILCTDNAAMVAAAAYFRYEAGLQHDWTLDIDPNARYVE